MCGPCPLPSHHRVSEMGFRCGIVGLPNVGKSTLFNALTETAAAQAANYPFCTIEPNVGRVAVPDPRLQRDRRDRQIGAGDRDPAGVRRHCRPRPRRLDRRRARQPVPRQYPRGGRDRPRAALLRGRRRHPCRGPGRSDRGRGDGRDRADAGRPGEPRKSASPTLVKKAQQGDKEAKIQASVLGQALELLRDSKPARLTEPKDARGEAGARPRAIAHRQAGPLRLQCRRGRRRRAATRTAPACSRRRRRRAPKAVIISAAIEAEIATMDPAGPARIPRRPRPDRDRPQPDHPRRLRPAPPDHLLHRRPQGGARLDGREGREGAAGRGHDPHRFRARLHPRRDHRL